MNFKFNAISVEEIEKAKGVPIENCVTDTTISTLALFIQKAVVDDDGKVGTSRSVAMTMIDEYLKNHEKQDLTLDIMEALVDAGFLSKELNVNQMREALTNYTKQVSKQLDNI